MGNAAIRKCPEDLTKCTESQLRVMINSVIINNPWNDVDNQADEDSLSETIKIMKDKGFRPITPTEYIQELKRQRKESSTTSTGIKVWLPLSDPLFVSKAEAKDNRDHDYFSSQQSFKHTNNLDSPVFQSTCSLSIRCTDSKDSAALQGSSTRYGGSGSGSIEHVSLPCSREDAVSEIIKSGSSAAVLSEIANADDDVDQDNIATEEWPMHGGVRPAFYPPHTQGM